MTRFLVGLVVGMVVVNFIWWFLRPSWRVWRRSRREPTDLTPEAVSQSSPPVDSCFRWVEASPGYWTCPDPGREEYNRFIINMKGRRGPVAAVDSLRGGLAFYIIGYPDSLTEGQEMVRHFHERRDA